MSLVDAVEVSISAAIESKRINEKDHAAMIEAVRQLAARADIAPANDNVTFPTLLKYFSALGLTPEQSIEIVKKEKRKSTTEKLSAKYRKRGGID